MKDNKHACYVENPSLWHRFLGDFLQRPDSIWKEVPPPAA